MLSRSYQFSLEKEVVKFNWNVDINFSPNKKEIVLEQIRIKLLDKNILRRNILGNIIYSQWLSIAE